jgi:hypothetical protein
MHARAGVPGVWFGFENAERKHRLGVNVLYGAARTRGLVGGSVIALAAVL